TAGVIEKTKPGSGASLLKDVRTGEHASYDRVVFEFAGPPLPGYHLEYVGKPLRECGSGKVHDVAGECRLRVGFEPANGGKKRKGHGDPLKVARDVEPMCASKTRVEWVLGLAAQTPYRVLELSDPPRIVVDVLHQGDAAAKTAPADKAADASAAPADPP